jgi:hypothetical protein
MKVYLAGPSNGYTENCMKVYLAGLHSEQKRANFNNDFAKKIYVLESYHYFKDWMIPYVKNHWNFLLDSGAFTFLSSNKNNIDWENYVNNYAEFINKIDCKLFFELDIDSIIGLKKVEKLRNILENKTQKKCIPVWHKSRGLDYFKNMCKEYDYVAIGGIVTKEITKDKYSIFNTLLKIAYKNNTKVHGLGFTSIELLKKYKFYSVDSTSWLYGNRGGFIYNFNGSAFDKIQVPKGKRMKAKKVAIHNFKEWVKFQKYAEKNL